MMMLFLYAVMEDCFENQSLLGIGQDRGCEGERIPLLKMSGQVI